MHNDDEKPTVSAVAEALIDFYDTPFGAKDHGRYQVSKKRLAELASRTVLTPDFLRELSNELSESGYFLMDRNDYVVVLASRVTNNYRRLPDDLIESYDWEDPSRTCEQEPAEGDEQSEPTEQTEPTEQVEQSEQAEQVPTKKPRPRKVKAKPKPEITT